MVQRVCHHYRQTIRSANPIHTQRPTAPSTQDHGTAAPFRQAHPIDNAKSPTMGRIDACTNLHGVDAACSTHRLELTDLRPRERRLSQYQRNVQPIATPISVRA